MEHLCKPTSNKNGLSTFYIVSNLDSKETHERAYNRSDLRMRHGAIMCTSLSL